MKVSAAAQQAGWFEAYSPSLTAAGQDLPDDDWQLLTSAEAGFAGLDVLFERHKDYVFRVAWGLVGHQELAEDVTQEVFLRLEKARRRARPRARFRTWLYQVTLNTARELRRRQREIDLDGAPEPAPAEPPDERLLDLERALDQLSERQREALVLRYFEGLSTRETAAVMKCRQGTLKSHLHRAVGLLKRWMVPESPT